MILLMVLMQIFERMHVVDHHRTKNIKKFYCLSFNITIATKSNISHAYYKYKNQTEVSLKKYWLLIIAPSNLCGGNIFSKVLYN